MSQVPPQMPQGPGFPQQVPPPKSGMSGAMIALIIAGVAVVFLTFVIALLVAILLPSLNRARETAYRSQCSNSLKQIGLAMLMYANDNQQRFPRTPADDEGNAGVSVIVVNQSNAGEGAPSPFLNVAPAILTSGPQVPYNCVPASMFWILRSQDLSPQVFNCLASNTSPDIFGGTTSDQRSNWSDIQTNLSYSMTCPFNGGSDLAKLFKWNTTLRADFPMVADINPGGPGITVSSKSDRSAIRAANSPNHRQDGQNVLYADGHVEWTMTPLVGRMINGIRDNIYCRSGYDTMSSTKQIDTANPYGGPANADDSVMLPAFQ